MNVHPYSSKGLIIAVLMLALSSLGQHAWSKETSDMQSNEDGTKQAEVSASVQSEVDAKGKEEMTKKRQALMKEALNAVSETKKALKALEDGNTKDALAALAEVTGQLEIIMSRDPHLSFVPIDVKAISNDLYGDLDTIKKVKKQAEDYLEDGEVQQARVLLSGLASELKISTISLPLGSYPDAIKAVVPLIDQGEIEEAKTALQAVLETLVVTNELVIPLPILRAEALIQKADELARKLEAPELKNITKPETEKLEIGKSQKEQILEQLQNARQHLKMAEALGYGLSEDRYKEFQASIENIEKKVHGEEATKGVFAHLKESLTEFEQFLFNE